MDLENLDVVSAANFGAFMQLKHPTTGDPLVHEEVEMGITLLGKDSDLYRRRIYATGARAKRHDLSYEQLYAETTEILAACTANWALYIGGEWVECTQKKAAEIYAKFPWIREQALAFSEDRENFLPSASTG